MIHEVYLCLYELYFKVFTWKPIPGWWFKKKKKKKKKNNTWEVWKRQELSKRLVLFSGCMQCIKKGICELFVSNLADNNCIIIIIIFFFHSRQHPAFSILSDILWTRFHCKFDMCEHVSETQFVQHTKLHSNIPYYQSVWCIWIYSGVLESHGSENTYSSLSSPILPGWQWYTNFRVRWYKMPAAVQKAVEDQTRPSAGDRRDMVKVVVEVMLENDPNPTTAMCQSIAWSIVRDFLKTFDTPLSSSAN